MEPQVARESVTIGYGETKIQVSGNRMMKASKIYQTRESKKEKSLVCILNELVLSSGKMSHRATIIREVFFRKNH